MSDVFTRAFWDERYRSRSLATREPFSARMEAEVCERVLGARRHGL